ncbi:MAG: glycoside hydrolase family 88 protein [Clostridiales bacterium]|nr:glycoside hydrolase family 88 protein [Clostridiales bacterium]
MNRRSFLKKTAVSGAAAGSLVAFPAAWPSDRPPASAAKDPLLEKVKLAMLTMQRDAWEQGVAAQAFLESGETELVILMAKEAVVRQVPDGRLAVISCWEGVTDPAANGEAVLFAADATGDPKFRKAASRMLEYLLERAPRTKEGVLYHVANKPQVWVDSLYMAPPFIALAGHPEEAVRQIEGVRRILWNPEKKLFSHNFDDGRGEFIRKDFWGVGNGWAAAGMARVIKVLPAGMADERRKLTGFVKEVIDGCLAHQRPDGLFHDFVDNPATFVETNLAQMLAYTIYRGVQGGWLDESYLKRADRMRRAARKKVDIQGYVQDVCGSPNFDSPGTATEGQAFFLLMEAAARDSAISVL